MKKSLIILIVGILSMFVPAQAEHLKFMGIPLTGTITQFQQKLATKGVTHNKRASATELLNHDFFKKKVTFNNENLNIMNVVQERPNKSNKPIIIENKTDDISKKNNQSQPAFKKYIKTRNMMKKMI